MDIFRNNTSYLNDIFASKSPCGVILSGIVGCGKTYILKNIAKHMISLGFDVRNFDGDDSKFRSKIRSDSASIWDEIRESGMEKCYFSVDEIQKEPIIFDAVKLAFDKAEARFLVSGSNPAFLRTTANDRLQRRGLLVPQFPLSIQEILSHLGACQNHGLTEFRHLLGGKVDLTSPGFTKPQLSPIIKSTVSRYLQIGGLPQAWLSETLDASLQTIKLVAERGISETYQATVAADDEIRQYLAERNSQEFTYKGVQQSLRSNKRSTVDRVVDHLMNHGYLFKKTPFLGEYSSSHSSYFAAYSWIDPGLVSYYATVHPTLQDQGFRLEAYVHSRLIDHLSKIPQKSNIYYFKPFKIKAANDALSFGSGEIDFVVKIGREITPIEVKLTSKIGEIDTELLEIFVKENKLPFGIVLYGGSTVVDVNKKLIYFPYWYI